MNIGCDIVKNERVKGADPLFIKKVLTNDELALYNELSDQQKTLFIAGRFAAKEAIIKAIDETVNMQEITILKNKNGSPKVIIGKPYHIKVSIAHEKDYTIAMAIALDL